MKNAQKEKFEVSITELPLLLREIRKSRKLTMHAFSIATGQSGKQEVYALETGRIKIGLNKFAQICQKLKIKEPTITVEL